MKIYKILFAIIAITLFSCEKEKNETEKLVPHSQSNCYVQKGPFLQGSQITLQELNNDFSPTGKSFNFETKDDFGSFDYNVESESNLMEFIANGYFFNEVTGKVDGPISLRNIINLSDAQNNNINILTTLAKDRIKFLVTSDGLTFSDARFKAENEILAIFNIPREVTNSNMSFSSMDISKSGDNNAILLAVSSILQYNNSPGELSELISKLSSDIKIDGIINNEILSTKILTNSTKVNSDSIIKHLTNRYSELGLNIEIPDLNAFLDQDGDNIVNSYDFKLISPTNSIIDTKPLFKWEEPERGENQKYKFQISIDESFENIIYSKNEISGNNHKIDITLNNKINYYWRLAFEDNEGATSTWSTNNFIIELAKVTLIAPISVEINNTRPLFEWESINAEKQSYHIQLSENSDFSTILTESSDITTNSYQLQNITLDNNKTYYWRVAFIDPNSVASEWSSSSLSINLGIIQLTAPIGQGSNTKPLFQWEKVNLDNITYHIQLSENSDFSTILTESSDITTNSYQLQNITLDNNKTYYWRVAFIDPNSVASEWSKSNFSILYEPIIILTSENKQFTNSNFILSWSSKSNVNCILEIGNTNVFGNFVSEYEKTLLTMSNITTYTIEEDLPLGYYIWKVSYINDGGIKTGEQVGYIDINDVVPISPEGSITNNKPLFIWESTDETSQKTIELTEIINGNHNIIFSKDVIGNSYQLDFELQTEVMYRWMIYSPITIQFLSKEFYLE